MVEEIKNLGEMFGASGAKAKKRKASKLRKSNKDTVKAHGKVPSKRKRGIR